MRLRHADLAFRRRVFYSPTIGVASKSPAPEQATTGQWTGPRLFVVSFIALFLELMLIRWAPSVVRLVAYYANLMLISSFLGLGLGAMTGERKWKLFGWFPAALAASVGFLLLCEFEVLPGSGAEARFYADAPRLTSYLVLIGVFAANAIVFVPLGQQIGILFRSLAPLRAYAWDLGGSLAGTVLFGVFSFTRFSPGIGMIVVMVLYLLLVERRAWRWPVPIFALTLWAVVHANDPAAIWSPYYYITITERTGVMTGNRAPSLTEPPPNLRTMTNPPSFQVHVNHDFYQFHGTLNLERYTGEDLLQITQHRQQYELPYVLGQGRDRVAVLGAGGGQDVEMALLAGSKKVDAIEIDPVLVKLSRRFNASGVYDDPRVNVIVDDGRAFLRSARPGYDVVVFGWLDSQALFSYMSNLRLDGYIYTVESLRTAYGLLNDDGVLVLSFMAQQKWLALKLIGMMTEATGKPPIVYSSLGQIVLCSPRGRHAPPPQTFGRFEHIVLEQTELGSFPPPATDDWPYLYLGGRSLPSDYAIVISALLVLSLASVLALRGRGMGSGDMHFLFLGLGFLLLETKSIGDCSLYFGATWLVTTIVVGGILLMVLAANLIGMRLARASLWHYAPLFASLLLLYFVPRNAILSLPFIQRLAWSLLIVPLPVFFAGLIFSTTFRTSSAPAMLFGANLIGATVGGFAEYLGMVSGTSSLMLLVVAAYGASLLFLSRNKALQCA